MGETHIFNPTLVNDFRFGYLREANERFVPPGALNVNDFGVNIVEPTAYKAIESVAVTGFFSVGAGTDASLSPDYLDSFRYLVVDEGP